MSKLIAIEITNEQALAFRLFMEQYNSIKLMQESEVFSIRGGSATLHFNRDGILDSIERRLYNYPKVDKKVGQVFIDDIVTT